MKIGNKREWQMMLIALFCMLCPLSSAMAQDFLSGYKKLSEKNIEAFMQAWAKWSETLAEDAKGDPMNGFFQMAFTDHENTTYIKEYNEGCQYTVLSTKLSLKSHNEELNGRKPSSYAYEKDITGERDIVPYVETGKPVLYLNNEIAILLKTYLDNDKDGSRKAYLSQYMKVMPDTGGYHLCSLPYIASFDLFKDCIAVHCRQGWGGGIWVKYKVKITKKEVISEYIR